MNILLEIILRINLQSMEHINTQITKKIINEYKQKKCLKKMKLQPTPTKNMN